jgi:hypothetical protein
VRSYAPLLDIREAESAARQARQSPSPEGAPA